MRSNLLIYLFLFVFLLSSPSLAAWNFDSESITVDLDIRSGLKVVRTGPQFHITYLTANISFVPLNLPEQEVLRIALDPQPKVYDENYVFRWDDPVPFNPGFSVDAKLKISQVFHNVGTTVFPYTAFSDDIIEYTKPRETIDSDHPLVVAQASELAAGETDYYRVVFKMADWTKQNVRYDLSTINQKASQKASWVLKTKEGVCDEITTLFMAMLRSVGIPARFVAGIAYTEDPRFPEKWGGHGWAEVYFPDAGWVPFDVTYGQFGFVDPTHIILKRAMDSGEADTVYSWLGSDVKVTTLPIDVTAELLGATGKVSDRVSLGVSVEQDFVGIGSYNLVVAELTNPTSSYIVTQVQLASIKEMDILSEKFQSVLVEPFSTANVFWLVKVLDSLSSHYTYTFPITVGTMRGTNASKSFTVMPHATVFPREEMERIMEADRRESEMKYSKDVSVSCSAEQETYYVYDMPKMSCTVKNLGNFPFKGLDVCFEDSCEKADLPIGQQAVFEHVIDKPDAGVQKVMFSVEGDEISKSEFIDIEVFDEPKIVIEDLDYPAEIEFKLPFKVHFTIKKKSASIPEDVKITFAGLGKEKLFEEEKLEGDKKYIMELNSEDLTLEPNEFVISVDYYDANDKLHTELTAIEINLVNVTFGQKMVIWLKDADRWLRGLFD